MTRSFQVDGMPEGVLVAPLIDPVSSPEVDYTETFTWIGNCSIGRRLVGHKLAP
jgi:hypothetical protein